MTLYEQNLIANNKFEQLWTNLWGKGRDSESAEFEISKNKFNSLNLQTLISKSKSIYSEPEWGFPKGRRFRGETDIACANREFFEETNIPESAYELIDLSFTETFTAMNSVCYTHTYFVAVLKDSSKFDLSQKLTHVQRREVSAVEWKSLSECKKLTRPHYPERRKIIEELEKKIAMY
jgi:8-oxo-dGTP pyrophosphatase MutT (NUDIX family)